MQLLHSKSVVLRISHNFCQGIKISRDSAGYLRVQHFSTVKEDRHTREFIYIYISEAEILEHFFLRDARDGENIF